MPDRTHTITLTREQLTMVKDELTRAANVRLTWLRCDTPAEKVENMVTVDKIARIVIQMEDALNG